MGITKGDLAKVKNMASGRRDIPKLIDCPNCKGLYAMSYGPVLYPCAHHRRDKAARKA
jgi:hypothetical protein